MYLLTGMYRGTGACVGTSSFGMSGVNAHMLLGKPSAALVISRVTQLDLHWEEQSFWPGPMLHHLAHPVGKGASSSGTCM